MCTWISQFRNNFDRNGTFLKANTEMSKRRIHNEQLMLLFHKAIFTYWTCVFVSFNLQEAWDRTVQFTPWKSKKYKALLVNWLTSLPEEFAAFGVSCSSAIVQRTVTFIIGNVKHGSVCRQTRQNLNVYFCWKSTAEFPDFGRRGAALSDLQKATFTSKNPPLAASCAAVTLVRVMIWLASPPLSRIARTTSTLPLAAAAIRAVRFVFCNRLFRRTSKPRKVSALKFWNRMNNKILPKKGLKFDCIWQDRTGVSNLLCLVTFCCLLWKFFLVQFAVLICYHWA